MIVDLGYIIRLQDGNQYGHVAGNMALLRAFEYVDVALNFKDSPHAGDKRKLSQQCIWSAIATTLA